MLKYDFGGAQYPLDAEAGRITWTVVDICTEKYFRSRGFTNKYIKANLLNKRVKLPRADAINVSRLLRYAANRYGFLGEVIVPVKFRMIINNIYTNLKSGGKLRLFDHLAILEPVMTAMELRGMRVTRAVLVNPPDEDLPSEWVVTMKGGK